MKEKLLIIGGGGHAVSVIEAVDSMNLFEIEGIIETQDKQKTFMNGIEVIGENTDLERLFSKKIGKVVIAVGSIGQTGLRRNLYKKCKNIGYSFPNIIDASAIVGKNITMGEGNFIGKGAILNTHIYIGSGCILNTGCILEHGCSVEDFVHIAPGSVLCGGVMVKRDTHIGAHSTIIQNITIGESTLIGAGSVVIKDVLSHKVAYGNPCREVRGYEQNHDYC
jgi:sugar O-acyltransferase (sialic acid O-acetyltransferase NeuD family)